MEAATILLIIILILCTNFILDKVLDYLNFTRLDPNLPSELQDFYEEDEYRRSQKYLKTKMRFGLLTSLLSFGVMLVVLLTGFIGTVDDFLRQSITDPVWLALAFFGVLFVLNDLISTPFSLYNTFVIEERFGFNKTKPGTYITDKIKGYLLTAVLGGGILFVLMTLINALQADFWIWFWVVIAVVTLLMQYLYATLLLPIFNKLTPMEPGELRSAIENYCKAVSFPIGNIMVMDGSRRSSKANAFFTGFGKRKRIVLFDTLVEQMTEEEVVAVLAHEVGHYKKKHVVQGYLITVLNMGLMLFVLSRLVFEPALSGALGASQPGMHLSLMTFGLLYTPISMATSLLFNVLSRKNEYQADDFANRTYKGSALGNALVKLHVKTLSNLRPHPAYVFVHYSHPPLLQRLAAIRS